MRCNNCGWDNPAGLSRCEKCGSPLANGNNYQNAPAANAPMNNLGGTVAEGTAPQASSLPLSKTVREASIFNDTPASSPLSAPGPCPNCGYQLRSNVSVCPNCHRPVNAENGDTVNEIIDKPSPAGRFGGTVRPKCNFVTEVGFSLTPIANDGEFKTPGKVDFEEEHVELTRSNIDPNNRTITSKVQAVMNFDGNTRRWSIQDQSAQQYTFVLCRNEMQITEGNILLIGDRKFVFHPFGQQQSADVPLTSTLIMGRQQSNLAGCRLEPLPYPGENDAPDVCLLRGESHELNRSLIDPDNYTITSKVQALLTFREGNWYIKDRSSLHTTYLLCSEPVVLKDGDTVLMGNRNFTFNC